jgi:hypothetical protein
MALTYNSILFNTIIDKNENSDPMTQLITGMLATSKKWNGSLPSPTKTILCAS